MERQSFIFYIEWRDALAGCSEEVRLEVYDAIVEYAASGTLPQLKPMAQVAFNFIKRDIDRNNERYNEILEIRRESGRKGGRPKKENQMVFEKPNGFLEKQTKANESKKSYNENVNVNVNDNVSLFVRENNITHKERENFLYHLLVKRNLLNPAAELERFINHYSKTGWKDKNGNDIVDRLSALKAWQIDPSATTLDSAQVNLWMSIILVLVPPEKDKTAFLGDFRGLEKENDKLIIYCTEALKNAIENALNRENIQQLNKLGIKTINYRLKKEK